MAELPQSLKNATASNVTGTFFFLALEEGQEIVAVEVLLKGLIADLVAEIFYFDQAGNLNAVRYDDWKIAFATNEGGINTAYRKAPAWPVIVNLRADPFESAPHDSGMYVRWYADLLWLFVPIQGKIAEFAATLKEYPPVTGGSLSGGLNYKAVRFRMLLTNCRAYRRHGTDPEQLTSPSACTKLRADGLPPLSSVVIAIPADP